MPVRPGTARHCDKWARPTGPAASACAGATGRRRGQGPAAASAADVEAEPVRVELAAALRHRCAKVPQSSLLPAAIATSGHFRIKRKLAGLDIPSTRNGICAAFIGRF